ncbi:MAG: 30S ribosomal protein S9 [Caldisericum sp.]|jgi:small subunit ribosomal protein S9|nr:30S ribosomal protein S9 [Caldisericum sp.]
MDKVILAVGRRKTSVARVVLTPGTGKVRVNGRDVNEYFNVKSLLPEVFKPLEITNLKDKFDIRANVEGGGFRGQADAIKLGIARALLKIDESLRPVLKSEGLLTRDPREKERKKYGLHSARKDRQYRKR